MWGNLHGWLISAVLAAVILAPLVWLGQMSGMSAPADVATNPANLKKLNLPVDPDEAWPIFTDDAYASDAYLRLIDSWDVVAERECEDFVKAPSSQTPAALAALIDVRHHKRMELFASDYKSLISYDSDHPRLMKLDECGEWCYKAGLSLHVHGRSKEAEPFLEAAFALGRQLYRERLIFDEYQDGAGLMDDTARAMIQTVTKGSELYDNLTEFDRQLGEYQDNRVMPIWAVISSVNQDVINRTAGDVLAFATTSEEPMWRVEATLKLGRYKYDAGTLGDQISAARAVRQLTLDHDPTVAAAAAAARDLTIETYRMIH
jgi:hypothetical protein